jgi:hypothetical protein
MVERRTFERRTFLGLGAGLVFGIRGRRPGRDRQPTANPVANPAFPRQDPAMVLEMVGVSHGNLPRVRQLLEARPALARAAVDWGYGDWEDALGAASHVGRSDVALLLLQHGARPTIFSAAMLGQLEVVRAFVAAAPGIQRTLGPHSIPLLAHARAGGERARPVREYLDSLGDAGQGPTLAPLTLGTATYTGRYRFGVAESAELVVTVERDQLAIARPGGAARTLRHLGDHAFFPVGAEAVRIRFEVAGGASIAVTVHDPDPLVRAVRAG